MDPIDDGTVPDTNSTNSTTSNSTLTDEEAAEVQDQVTKIASSNAARAEEDAELEKYIIWGSTGGGALILIFMVLCCCYC